MNNRVASNTDPSYKLYLLVTLLLCFAGCERNIKQAQIRVLWEPNGNAAMIPTDDQPKSSVRLNEVAQSPHFLKYLAEKRAALFPGRNLNDIQTMIEKGLVITQESDGIYKIQFRSDSPFTSAAILEAIPAATEYYKSHSPHNTELQKVKTTAEKIRLEIQRLQSEAKRWNPGDDNARIETTVTIVTSTERTHH